ncbi:F0F1 ATP synthase subunit delta [Legionella sp. 227]|uniref:F0F1 ATP synthase subunit delta n=1 Tax=Legionella sp. 227 TaxID=3367288 RepID=UPI00370D34E8
MEFSWSSFILELINFIVLVWILKFFFYSPVQQVILKRKQAVQNDLDKAQAMYDEAHKLQEQYTNRLQIWDIEKEQERKKIQRSLQDWKISQQEAFKKNLAQEKEKIIEQEKQKLSSIINQNAHEALLNASRFSTKFLLNFADIHLEKKCIDKTLAELSSLSDEQITLLQKGLHENKEIIIESAFPLEEQQKNTIAHTIHNKFVLPTVLVFRQNPDLLAGLNIKIGHFFLRANLRDELAFFVETENEKC